MGWSTEILGSSRSLRPSKSDDRWGALLVPQQVVEVHPRAQDRAFLLVRYTIVAAMFTVLLSPYALFYLKLPYTLPVHAVYGLSLGVTLLILQRTRSVRLAANWTLTAALTVLLFHTCMLGGVSSLAYPWFAVTPVAAMLLRGVQGGVRWTLAALCAIVGVGVAEALGVLPHTPAMTGIARGATTVTIASLTVALGALAWLAESRAEELLSNLRHQKEVFQERSVRDWLTGLANRSLLTECLIQSWERARRHGPRGALFFIDLNDFKQVNDEHGHAAGDQVLRDVALRLQDTVRSSDLVGRLGGDELVMIIEGVESHSDVAVLAEKISEAIEEPVDLDGQPVRVGASIGVAFYPDRDCHLGDRVTRPSLPPHGLASRGEVDHESVRRLLEKADTAMYIAKRKGLRFWVHEHAADETLPGTTSLLSEPPPAA